MNRKDEESGEESQKVLNCGENSISALASTAISALIFERKFPILVAGSSLSRAAHRLGPVEKMAALVDPSNATPERPGLAESLQYAR